jgi:ubiquinone/menaquinone biosynthesis C-methylase UbiE
MAGEPDDVDAMVEPVVPSRHRWLAGLLDAGPGDRVVDLGCGTGASLVHVAPAVDDGLVVGVDLSAAVLARAAGALAPVAGAARVMPVRADLKGLLPFADAAVDRVFCHNVLECLPDPGALVAEAGRVLRPGGRLVLAHSDFDTLVFASEDLELTGRPGRARPLAGQVAPTRPAGGLPVQLERLCRDRWSNPQVRTSATVQRPCGR